MLISCDARIITHTHKSPLISRPRFIYSPPALNSIAHILLFFSIQSTTLFFVPFGTTSSILLSGFSGAERWCIWEGVIHLLPSALINSTSLPSRAPSPCTHPWSPALLLSGNKYRECVSRLTVGKEGVWANELEISEGKEKMKKTPAYLLFFNMCSNKNISISTLYLTGNKTCA